MNTMHLEDFTVLGRTVPEESQKYGKRVCMAGFSRLNNQFVRIYPLLVPVGDNIGTNGFRARYSYAVSLRRNENDNRTESWRVEDERNPSITAWDRAAELPKQRVIEWLNQRVVKSIDVLNQCR